MNILNIINGGIITKNGVNTKKNDSSVKWSDNLSSKRTTVVVVTVAPNLPIM